MVGEIAKELDTPALIVDLDLLERNIRRMADFFNGREAKLRPHAKTHKCPEIALKQIEAGARGITCAKLGEAEAMAEHGIGDILIANEIVGGRKVERLVRLAERCNVIVAVDDVSNAQMISDAFLAAGKDCLDVLVEIDIGMGRCGVRPGGEAVSFAKRIARMKGINLRGIMGYEGHVVSIEDFEERRSLCLRAVGRLPETKSMIEKEGLEVGIVSAGGTGTYNITGALTGITEVQAGSYATMDAKYSRIVKEFDCALSVLATVISRPADDRAIIDVGMKSTTTEFGFPMVKDMGGMQVSKLNEEHGILRLDDGAKLSLGDKIELFPSHGCTTINLHDRMHAVRKGYVEATWGIAGRGKST